MFRTRHFPRPELALFTAFIGVLASDYSSASLITFEYRADQFSLQADGINHINDFGSRGDARGSDYAGWSLGTGTVFTQDGYAVFTDPGRSVSFPGVDLDMEWSYLASTTRAPGDRDWVAQSNWSSQYLPELPGGYFSQYLDDGTQYLGLNIGNWSDGVADAMPDGSIPGLAISFTRALRGYTILEHQSFAIDEADILGDIVFQLNYDFASERLEGAFSLDGGLSFVSPFSSYASDGSGNFRLMGDPVSGASDIPSEVPIVSTAWLLGIGLLGLSRRKYGKA